MKSVFATLTFVIVCCGTMLVIGKVAKMKSSAEDEVRAAMSQRTKAGNDGDVKTIENTMADDYVQTDIFGRVQTKSEWLADYYKPMAELIKKISSIGTYGMKKMFRFEYSEIPPL